MNKGRKRILTIILCTIVSLGLIFAGSVYFIFFRPAFNIDKSSYIYIDNDDNIDSVFNKIVIAGKTSEIWGIEYLARKYDYANKIKTGRYQIKPKDNVRYFFRRIYKGYQSPVNLTVPSVRTTDRLVKTVSKQLMMDSLDLAKLVEDSSFCSQIGYNLETIPALFIPNTYEVYWNITPKDFVERMIKENKSFWNENRIQKAAALSLNPIQVATLASIVEEETANNKEKPMVAGLYLNRLKKGMLLQADPTVKFSLKEFGLKRILNKHLLVDSPYNTYKYAGLPPGPIRIPSIKGIESVLNYAKHDYLYMCAKEDFSGTHNFARNVAEHQANAKRYQQALNERKIK